MVDQSDVGRSFAPVIAYAEPRRLRYFLDALNEQNRIYREERAAHDRCCSAIPIPPTYLFCLQMLDNESPYEFLAELQIEPARVLHGEQSFSYHEPVVVGDTLTIVSTVADVAVKAAGALTRVVIESNFRNQHDVHVADTLCTIMVRNG
ncbi:MaoC family dehydratase N-terminal domain-containing protein [Bradyrhizobium sp. G127]|uniref:FAS1-like dehydratase domain-containing protein n=1 Tax=Bradyrhizobium sp. G127 TaxID=2904800 RepID=UPI001F22595D|nr:MaoC family dehydratase N-terminal domain-containing protein [Bradyrhizobium sp. G127]MCF2524853.1 MaoC family dehydratase N-terminal domain-containing protein [Bradyrhizobium sp. G127]